MKKVEIERSDYLNWLKEIKSKIHKAKTKAILSISINLHELLGKLKEELK